MYKVLLVDDEMFVRKGLLNLIDWEALGYEICGEADNGEEALALMDECQPDLVVTDIRMPVLDGLGLIAAVVNQRQWNPAFIIVSGYHDFKYAQQALRYGVNDYILKPIDEEELTATLRKLASVLGMRKLATLAGGSHVTASIMEALLHGSCQERDISQYAAAIGLPQESRFVYVLAELHPAVPDQAPEWSAKDVVCALQPLADRSDSRIPMYEQSPGMYGVLLDLRRLAAEQGDLSAMSVYQSLRWALSKVKDAAVTLYVGQTVNRLQDVKESYQSANEALSYEFAEDGRDIILIDDVRGTPLYYFDMAQELYASLLEQLEENDEKAYTASIDKLFAVFREQRFAPNAVTNAITRCVIGVINIIRKMDGDENELQSLPAMLDWQSRHVRLEGLRQLMTAFAAEAAGLILRLRGEQAKGGIEKIRKYIEANYRENLNLKSIASIFYMNPVYLGQLFRKTYGVYFNDFLLGLRVKEAKQLLRQTDLRMYEIAEKVGFANADYFVTQFEKLEHMTPTDYRNKLRGRTGKP
ncbi:DNA-binding response regulator [Paenibacillus sambharensis]|uniref:DNA-binding response regulator n=1 Tax=Paenibacillus sambharensis TaxID=1803190 RepID=A0A2W1L5D1_9BACL|nr:response regulator transcription factor [Paenibacillus sambharensis]PZD94486.1 DNA-binding response regulator [Paenibacillus sambharensis]